MLLNLLFNFVFNNGRSENKFRGGKVIIAENSVATANTNSVEIGSISWGTGATPILGSAVSSQGRVCFFVAANLVITLSANRFLIRLDNAAYGLLIMAPILYGLGLSRLAGKIQALKMPFVLTGLTGVPANEKEGVSTFFTAVFLNSLAASNLFFLVGIKDFSVIWGPVSGLALTVVIKKITEYIKNKGKNVDAINGLLPPALINFVGSAVLLFGENALFNGLGWCSAAASLFGLVVYQFRKTESVQNSIAHLVSMIPFATLLNVPFGLAVEACPPLSIIAPPLCVLGSYAITSGITSIKSRCLAAGKDPRPNAISAVGLWRGVMTSLMLLGVFETLIHIPHPQNATQHLLSQAGLSSLIYVVLIFCVQFFSRVYDSCKKTCFEPGSNSVV